MSVQILSGNAGALLYCNTTDWGFGPLFDSEEQAERFLEWLRNRHINDLSRVGVVPLGNGSGGWLRHTDPRSYSDSDLEKIYNHWKRYKNGRPAGYIDGGQEFPNAEVTK